MDDKSEDNARRAREEFAAASRAVTPAKRAAHRAEAERYVELIREEEQAEATRKKADRKPKE